MKECLLWGLEGPWAQELLSLWNCGAFGSQSCMCPPSWDLSAACTLGTFVQASSRRRDGWRTQSLTPLPPQKMRAWGWKFQASDHSRSFSWPALIDKPSGSPCRVTSLEQKMLLSSWKFQVISELSVRNWGRHQMYISYFPKVHHKNSSCSLSPTCWFPSQWPLLRVPTLSDSRRHSHCFWDLCKVEYSVVIFLWFFPEIFCAPICIFSKYVYFKIIFKKNSCMKFSVFLIFS